MPIRPPAYLALSAVAAATEGTAIGDGTVYRTFGLQVTATGSPTGLVCRLEGSIDGTNYFTLATWDITAPLTSGAIVFAVDKPVTKVRANLTTLSGGTAPTVTAYISRA
jgi:hypothetical protein